MRNDSDTTLRPNISRRTATDFGNRSFVAAVMVEFAVVATVVVSLFLFGRIEFCRVAMIRHTVDTRSTKGLSRGIIPRHEVPEVTARGRASVVRTIGLPRFLQAHVSPALI